MVYKSISPETNIAPENRPTQKETRKSSNLPFSGAKMLVSGRVYVYIVYTYIHHRIRWQPQIFHSPPLRPTAMGCPSLPTAKLRELEAMTIWSKASFHQKIRQKTLSENQVPGKKKVSVFWPKFLGFFQSSGFFPFKIGFGTESQRTPLWELRSS